jgi:glycosyltransferase involved in cell wall biosynthesis
MTTGQTVGLMMIVKDEEKTLPRLTNSLMDDNLKWKIDYWTIVDTGSTDNTEALAQEAFTGLPGQFIHDEWRGFGPSKNVALHLAELHTDWLLWMDADEVLDGSIEILDADWIDIEEINGSLRFWKPRLFRSNRGFTWTGRAHEYLSSPMVGNPVRSRAFTVVHHGDGGTRGDKFGRDLGLLEEEWNEDPTNARTAFYTARTYDDVGDTIRAVEWYRRRLTMPGWEEESFYARYRLGACLLGSDPEAGCGHLWRAWGMRPVRAEPLVALAEHYRTTEQWTLAYEAADMAFRHCWAQPGSIKPVPDGLFVDVTATEWRAAYEQSISAWYTDHRDRGKHLIEWLRGVVLPEPYESSVEFNRAAYR